MKKHISGDEVTTIPYVGAIHRFGLVQNRHYKGFRICGVENPEEIYVNICATQGCKVDRCVLYICRSAVYYAENETPDPEKLKRWNWTDRKIKAYTE